jgi:hypothetical protein
VLKVAGQTRLQAAFAFAQLAKQASAAASATRSLVLAALAATTSNRQRMDAAHIARFISRPSEIPFKR